MKENTYFLNDRRDCSIEFSKTAVDQEAFHAQWYNKASDTVCGHEKSNKSDSENGIQRTGVNGYNVPFVNNRFTKQVFTLNLIFNLVSDGNNIFFISLI